MPCWGVHSAYKGHGFSSALHRSERHEPLTTEVLRSEAQGAAIGAYGG